MSKRSLALLTSSTVLTSSTAVTVSESGMHSHNQSERSNHQPALSNSEENL